MANEKRLIDANFTKAAIQNYIANNEVTEAFVKIAGHICGMLDDCETVDAVEVVRCKDCKKWEYDENFSGWCVEWRRRTLGDHFCSYGERSRSE